MSEPYVGEIRMLGFNFPPQGWANCDGSLLAISQNDVLFELIGTTYGGDGQSTFALPDLRGRLAVDQGNSHVIGEVSGTEAVTLTVNQMANHAHHVCATSGAGTPRTAAGNFLSKSDHAIYGDGPLALLNGASVGFVGGGQPHPNLQPFLTVTFAISLFGVFPSQN